MSVVKLSSEALVHADRSSDLKKVELEPLDTVVEEREPSEIFDRPVEQGDFVEISPRIFGLKDVVDPLTVPSLNNAIYELGVVNLCWPDITEPVFETRTCFPKSYYTNTTKERLLLAYAENFRRQIHFHFNMRKPLLLQCPNECGLQKMVCTSIRPTKLCFAGTNHWQGIASLVGDFFDYEPLTKPMLHMSSNESTGPTSSQYVTPTTSNGQSSHSVTSMRKRKRHNLESTEQDPLEHVGFAGSCFEGENEAEIIAKGWAIKLNRLAPDQRLFAEKIINDTLFEAEMGTLTRNGVCFMTSSFSQQKEELI